MVFRRILLVLLALPVLSGSLLVLTADAPGYTAPGKYIRSDGSNYTISELAGGTAVKETQKEGLPVVGSRKRLLKLLLERGALYDPSGQRYGGRKGSYAYEEGDFFDIGVDDVMPVPEDMPMPSSAPAPGGAAATGVPAPATAALTDGEVFTVEEPAAEAAGGGGHSQTNEQVAGVSEGDIVKTDGRYIYAMSQYSGGLRIIRAEGEDLAIVSKIDFSDIYAEEFYLIGGDRLAVVGREYVPFAALSSDGVGAEPRAEIRPDRYYGWYQLDYSVLVIYDISDRSAPAEMRRVSMDGARVSTRVVGGVVYLVTNKFIWGAPYDEADSQFILPYCRDTAAGESYAPVGFDSIFYIPDTDDCNYMLIGAIDVYGDGAFEPKAYLGAGSNLYMSQNAMYVTKTRWVQPVPGGGIAEIWPQSGEKTDILRFAIDGAEVRYSGTGTVDGSPLNQYSMDEFNGFFRIATTDWSAGTYVTVLNAADMHGVGRTEPLAPGERMQSMRFMGDTGYVVTFQNMDPLFTIDLSDPYSPKVMGELKIPGFSQYLHPVGDGFMLGIGRDTQEIYTRDSKGVETVVGFRDVGMKVSLFDVSDPYDPKEVDTLPLGEGWTEVVYNPRALMCDRARGFYGFTMEMWNSGSQGLKPGQWQQNQWGQSALLLQVENGRLALTAALGINDKFDIYGSRLCFIGDTLYLVFDRGIAVYDYVSFEMTGIFEF